MRRAILQCADTGPVDSLAYMLHRIGWEAVLPSDKLLRRLKGLGGFVMSNKQLRDGWGYEPTTVGGWVDDIRPGDVLFDVKAHQTHDRLLKEWPHLEGRVIWYRINGSEPEHVIKADGTDCGDEVNPPCPVVTPNQWYSGRLGAGNGAYSFWPNLIGKERYSRISAETAADFSAPICLIHNVEGWGYGTLIEDCRKMGVKVYGKGSPDGLLQHAGVAYQLRSAVAMVHLKTSDAPGYALLEAVHAGCPIILPRRLIRRCRMGQLFWVPSNCLAFDAYDDDLPWDECTDQIESMLQLVTNPDINRRIGRNARARYAELEWNDPEGFAAFLQGVVK